MGRWTTNIAFSTILSISVQLADAQLSPIITRPPTDAFTRTFLYVYNDAGTLFMNVKGKQVRNGNLSYYACKRILPGAAEGYISGDAKPTCVFDFGNYKSLDEADAAMRKLSLKVSNSFAQKAMVKFVDSSDEKYLVKRTAIAQLVDGGFYAYNILIDVVKKGNDAEEYYGVELSIRGGAGTLYKIVWKNEPTRSVFFNQSFKHIYAQFDAATSYSCTEQLPGFTCNQFDSSGKEQLMMEKLTDQFRDARVEFECLSSNIRAILGEKFVYYTPPANDEILADDYDKTERRSISTSLVKRGDNDYVIRLIMYHP